jgi:hypothetical protein
MFLQEATRRDVTDIVIIVYVMGMKGLGETVIVIVIKGRTLTGMEGLAITEGDTGVGEKTYTAMIRLGITMGPAKLASGCVAAEGPVGGRVMS